MFGERGFDMKKFVVLVSVMVLLCGTAGADPFWMLEDTGDFANPDNWSMPLVPGDPAAAPLLGDRAWHDGWVGRGPNAVCQLSTDVRTFGEEPSQLREFLITGYSTLELNEGAFIAAVPLNWGATHIVKDGQVPDTLLSMTGQIWLLVP